MGARGREDESAGTEPVLALPELADEDACLDYLRDLTFPAGTPCPKCERPTRFHRVRGRSAYACQYCGCHVYPAAGTIFRRSTTDLRTWFRAVRVVCARHGAVTVGELADELRINRPTASRMLARIVPVAHAGAEMLFASAAAERARAPRARSTTPGSASRASAERLPGHPANGPLSSDLVREELLATLTGLRKDLSAAELRARAVHEEVDALRHAVAALEALSGGDARSPVP